MECLQGCTRLDPTRRLTAQMAAGSLFLDSKALRYFRAPSGCSSWMGGRGEFCLQFGLIGPDVRDYLCGDAWWTESAPALRDRPKKKLRAPDVDKDNKVELVYTTGEAQPGEDASLNGAPVLGQCPVIRLNAWIRAFKKVNAALLKLLDLDMIAQLARLSLDDLGLNGQYFLAKMAADWFCRFVSLQMMTPAERLDTAHFDGGASVLHLGLTLWGRRRVYLNLADPAGGAKSSGADDLNPPQWVVTHQQPGSVYLANFCAPWHQVGHEGADDPDELFDSPSGGTYKVAIMFRTSCFGYARGRTTSTPPGPKKVFEIVSTAVQGALLSNRFRLPSLQECLEHEARLQS